MPAARREPATLRLATWNIAWFTALFDDEDRPAPDDMPSARYRTTRAQQLQAVAAVLRAVDPDGLMIIEAPDTGPRRSTVRALEAFAAWSGLRQRRACIGFASTTEQEIAFLWDPDVLAARHAPGDSAAAPRFDGQFLADLDHDAAPEPIRFDKPPLELAVTLPGGGVLHLIGVHAKSKSVGGETRQDRAQRMAIENRRKQLAQCLWIRARVEDHLAAGHGLVVLGDLNDGPGLDEFERLFGRSGVEIVLGSDAPSGLRLTDPHAAMALASRVGVMPTTARFYIKPPGRFFEALLDFVMVSPGLAARLPVWRIWHPFNDPEVVEDAALSGFLLAASDHFPVSLDIPI